MAEDDLRRNIQLSQLQYFKISQQQYFICSHFTCVYISSVKEGSSTPRVFVREWSGWWMLSESCSLSFYFSAWRPAQKLNKEKTKNKTLESAWSPACPDASRGACEKMEEKESKGNNERTMDGTAERRPTKKKVNLGKTAHCSPLPTPVWPYKQNFPAHLSECLSHTWWAYEAKLRAYEAEFSQDDQISQISSIFKLL